MKTRYTGSGKVFLNNQVYECDLYLNKKHGGIVININYIGEALGSTMMFPFEIEYLYGDIENKFDFILYNLSRKNIHQYVSASTRTIVFTYEAQYIAYDVGGRSNRNILYSKSVYLISDILEWGQETIYDISQNDALKSKYKIISNLYNNDDYYIIYIVTGSMLPISQEQLLRENIKLNQIGAIEISTKRDSDLYYFNKIFNRIKQLVEFSTLEESVLREVYMFPSDINDEVNSINYSHPIRIYGHQIIDQKSTSKGFNPLHNLSWITLPELIEKNCIEQYFEKYEQLRPILELYLEYLHEDMSIRRMFLNVVQALETYHANFICNNVEKYKVRVNDLCNGLSNEEAQQVKRYLLANLKGNNIILECRLADLMYAEREIRFDTGDIEYTEFPEIIKNTRNIYTHYGEKHTDNINIISEGELSIYTRALYKVLDYYILKEIGYIDSIDDVVEIRQKLIYRWGNISQDLELRKLSNGRREQKPAI